ncbi:MAG: tRNA (N(6)-L-threonylcarbamoyladenosine(37)-C(2))-methylthiotransferase MtaB [Planctomycetota bacterium]
MKTFAVHTLGCKVNQYESQQIRQVLEQSGLTAATRMQQPAVVVVNTCCVTHIASAKSRQNIRKIQKTHPAATVIVTGCLPAGQSDELKNLQNIIIAKEKSCLPDIIERLIAEHHLEQDNTILSKPTNRPEIKDKKGNLGYPRGLQQLKGIEKSDIIQNHPSGLLHSDANVKETGKSAYKLGILNRFTGQSRAFLKVQDGCDAYCTYCIIPKIRTNVCNKNVKTALKEANSLIRAGHKEIILTGIFLGAYGQTTARRKKWDPDKTDSLAELVNQVASIDGLVRLRLSSLEPLDVTNRLLEVMTGHKNIAPHLHLPLQSGSGNILKQMARQYTTDDFMRVVERVKNAFDRPAITTDIIVGFPGETEDDFQQTLEIAKKVGFSKIHVFSFSIRKNTAAVKMAKLFGKVSPQEIKHRSTVLQQIDNELQEKFRQSCAGLNETVLIEKTNPPRGRCSRYFMVDLKDHPDAKRLQKGQITDVVI